MKEYKFTFTNGTTRVVQALSYKDALIMVYNPRTKIDYYTETPCVYRYNISITNIYIPQEVGEFSWNKNHEIYATRLLTKDDLDNMVQELDLDIESERLYEDDYEIVDYEHTISYIGVEEL